MRNPFGVYVITMLSLLLLLLLLLHEVTTIPLVDL